MKITIDTATDSRDEIRRAVEMLMAFVEGRGEYPRSSSSYGGSSSSSGNKNIFDNPEPGVGNMFAALDATSSQPASSESSSGYSSESLSSPYGSSSSSETEYGNSGDEPQVSEYY